MTVNNYLISAVAKPVTGAGGYRQSAGNALAESGCDAAIPEIDKKTVEETAAEIRKGPQEHWHQWT
jgi:hypothetical protein